MLLDRRLAQLCNEHAGRGEMHQLAHRASAVDGLEQRIRTFVHEQTGLPHDMAPGTDVVDDARIYGDDVWELVEEFARRFNVRMDGFRWHHHSGPEGCNPLWLVFKPWWAHKTHVPIRLSDLVESARRGVWVVRYPPSEAEVEPPS
jgi:hypothetical protein